MKIRIINSSWLKEFGTFGADFFTLLRKGDYEEILTLTDGEIRKRIKNINLSNRDVIELEGLIATEFKQSSFNLQVFTKVRPKRAYKMEAEKQKALEEKHLIKTAELSKDRENLNLKKNYVLLLYGLRISLKRIRDEQEELKDKMKHNKELLLKAELV